MEAIRAKVIEIHHTSQLITHNLSQVNSGELTTDIESFLVNLSQLNYRLDALDYPQINLVTTLEVLPCIHSYLHEFLHLSANYFRHFDEDDEAQVIIMHSKIELFLEYIEHATHVDPNDLFSLDLTHDRRRTLNRYITYHGSRDAARLQKKYNDLMLNVVAGQAFICKSYYEEIDLIRTVKAGFYAMYYTAFKDKALKKTKLFHARPKLEVAQSLWNILEHSLLKNLMRVVYDSVKVNKVIFVPRTVTHVTAPLNEVSVDNRFEWEGTPLARVQVRVLSPFKLSKLKKSNKSRSSSVGRGLLTQHRTAVILHIHGGGFVAMSSASHQCYTRKWVNTLGIACLSIDYRLAPEWPFPAALDDVWQVYNWLISHGYSRLGLTPLRIYLAGDSAGGNLALALTYKAINEGIQLPTGLFLSYPALNLSKNQYSKSLLLSIEDNLLPHTFLKLCADSYLQGQTDPDLDYYASPIKAPDSILKLLPPVRILVGDKDPLHDECWRFVEKLVSLGKDVHLKVFEGVIHGALNLCYKGGVPESNDLVDQISAWIREVNELLPT